MEKWQGSESTPYLWEEDAWVTGAKQIKDANPNASVIVWYVVKREEGGREKGEGGGREKEKGKGKGKGRDRRCGP